MGKGKIMNFTSFVDKKIHLLKKVFSKEKLMRYSFTSSFTFFRSIKSLLLIFMFLFVSLNVPLVRAQTSKEDKKLEELFFRGEKYFFQKKYNIAYSVLFKVVEQKPDHKRALPLLADVAFFKGDYQEALKYYRQTVDLISNPYKEYYRMGQIYLLLKKPDEAIAQFKKALEYNELLSIANFQLGFIYFSQKRDLANAKKYWQKFIEQSPTDAQSEAVSKILRKVEKGEIYFPKQELYEIRE